MMPTSKKVALLAMIALSLASAGAAKDAGLPEIDVQKLCRTSQIDLQAEGSSALGSIDSCVTDEKEARDQIVKNLASYAASDRARCIQPRGYLPSYVEWLTCLQTASDVRKLRADRPAEAAGAAASAGGPRSGGPARGCPVTHFHEDGSIDWIIAC